MNFSEFKFARAFAKGMASLLLLSPMGSLSGLASQKVSINRNIYWDVLPTFMQKVPD
jgi:hypothetical protein